MVSISHETQAQTEARLLQVISKARLDVFDGPYAFLEFPLSEFPGAARAEALALVRDRDVWSQLVPYNGDDAERFQVFCIHFPAGVDNSGFVGWLASRVKQRFGTGVVVTCGSNVADGGIFDYWGVPVSVAPQVMAEINALVSGRAERA